MIKEDACLVSTDETAFALRQALGGSYSWHTALECMRNDDYRLFGLRLLPATRGEGEYHGRPFYDVAHVRKFILDMREACRSLASAMPLSAVRGDYDSNVHWKAQTTAIRPARVKSPRFKH